MASSECEKVDVARTTIEYRRGVFPQDNVAAAVSATLPAAATSSTAFSPTTAAGRNGAAVNPPSVEELQHVNAKLQQSVELLQSTIVRLGDDSQHQLETMSAQLEQLLAVNQSLQKDNDDLKRRVADDVLRQRQTNRIEMAVERAKVASQVRTAGLRRLEAMEAVLMESHDDLFHVQRFDAAIAPQREVSFVFHYVSNVVFPLAGAEQFVMNVYQQILRSTAQRLRGYTVSSCMGMDVFAFQSATTALEFSKDCHEQVVRLGWPEQTERVPFFSTISDSGYVLFRGPRIHTCIYTCNPETEVNAATGRSIYFGPEVKVAVDAALCVSSAGEIVVNDRCGDVLIREHRVVTDGVDTLSTDKVDALRQSLGKNWDVIRLPSTYNVIASLLPLSLKGRRAIDAARLAPTPKYPAMDGIDPQATAFAVLKTLKGQKVDVIEMHGGRKRVARFVEADTEADSTIYDSAAKLLEYYTMQRERDNVIALYRRTEQSAAALERVMMESEDRYEVSRRKPLDPSETAFVCTIDTGDETVWDKVLSSSSMQGERDQVQNQVRGAVHSFARQYYGFLMNGNYVDVFTYVFREVEQALAFVSGVYIQINRLGTKMTGQEVFLMRAGISSGPMSTIYRNMEDGVLKCTGPVIRLSATLSDLAQNGEILAMEDVIQEFHKKNENLLDTQYNMVRQQGRFVGDFDSPSTVHSILPRPFAFRRQQLMNSAAAPVMSRPRAGRSAKAVLAIRQKQFARRDVEKLLADQLERLERFEASRMATEDAFELSKAPPVAIVRNPWLFTSQPQIELVRRSKLDEDIMPPPTVFDIPEPTSGSRRGVGLGFLFCDVVGTSWIARELPDELLSSVYQHYNSILQDIMLEFGAFIVKTSGGTGYVAAFHPPVKALEVAVRIQQQLLATSWPSELQTIEPTLFVKDARTGVTLFNGLRAQIAVHYSTHYKWKLLPPPPPPPAISPSPTDAQEASLLARSGGQRSATGARSSNSRRKQGAKEVGSTAARNRVNGAGSESGRLARKRNGDSAAAGGTDRRESSQYEGQADNGNTALAMDTVTTYVEVSGTALSELVYLGRLAHGGEIRMSLPFVDVVRRTTAGRLLLQQLVMRIVAPTTAPSALTSSGGTAGSREPRRQSSAGKRNEAAAGADGGSSDAAASAEERSSESRRRARSSSRAQSVAGDATGTASGGDGVGEVAVSRWIVAVLRSQEGRLQFLLPTPDGRAGAATTGGTGSSVAGSGAGAAGATLTDQSLKRRAKEDGDNGKKDTTITTTGGDKPQGRTLRQRGSSVTSNTSAARQHAVTPPHREAPWFLQTESCTLPLPSAVRGPWDQPHIFSRSGYPESERVQNALEYVLRLFPADLQQTNGVNRLIEAALAAPSPTATPADRSLAGSSRSSPGSPLVALHDMSASTRSQNMMNSSVNSEASVRETPHLSPAERRKKIETVRHYVLWMRVAQHVLDCVLGAFRVANDGVKAAKPRKGAAAAAAGVGSAQGGLSAFALIDPLTDISDDGEDAFGGDASVNGGLGPSLSITGLPQGGDAPNAGAHTPSPPSVLPLPPPPPSFKGLSMAGPHQSPLSESLRLGGSLLRGARGTAQDNYLRAVDSLDDACRSLTEGVGKMLGKVAPAPPAVPQAPKNVAKKTITPPRRRF